MLHAFARAFKTPDLRNKLLFTLALLAIYRFGVFMPTPGVNYGNVMMCVDQAQQGAGADLLGAINLFSGGALLQLSVFALGVMPYITSSIIIQLLRVVIPHFEALHKEGQAGTAKLTQYTRYLTIGLAVLQSATIITMVRTGQFFPGCTVAPIPDDSIITQLMMILVMTTGTCLIMWMGELITEKGVGNGMSILIFTSIAAGFPASLGQILSSKGWLTFTIVCLLGLLVIVGVIYVEQSQRRIPVQYTKRMIGSRTYGGTSTYIPIKVNQAGVIPVIFASSLLAIPTMATSFGRPDAAWVQWINTHLSQSQNVSWLYVTIYFALIVFFAFFYVSITFNPEEIADNMKKYGGFIPNVRAGKPTERYLSYVINRILTPGSIYLALIALMPVVALAVLGATRDFPFGGASILIIVGVGLETVKQIDAKLQQHHYEGILR
ncbi:preprotein translocase subunit SecY [Dermabacteraceae bacterium TAE3-ERU27]|nr:preprotein translocase subunit SecY [Dermabacteraceae bacterium TAE3-ERU27]